MDSRGFGLWIGLFVYEKQASGRQICYLQKSTNLTNHGRDSRSPGSKAPDVKNIRYWNWKTWLTQQCPLMHGFAFPGFCCPRSSRVWKQMIVLLMYSHKVHSACAVHLISSRHIGASSSHIALRIRVSTGQYNILRNHTHVTFVTAWYL